MTKEYIEVPVTEKDGNPNLVSETLVTDSTIKLKVYKRRWLILIIYSCYNLVSTLQWIQYSIIANLVMKYYNVSSSDVDWTSMIFMLTFIPFILPASFFLDRWGMRRCLEFSAVVTAIGSWIKVLSVAPDRYYVTLIGQTLSGIGQVFMLGIPPRLATVWFGADQVSTACSICIFGNQCGIAFGFLFPPIIVRYHENPEDIGTDLKLMFQLTAGASTLLLLLIIIFLKERPPLPPSPVQAKQRLITKKVTFKSFALSLKRLITNPGYAYMLGCYGISIGVLNAICTLLNQIILIYFENSQDFAGRVGLMITIGGMIGSVIFGVILDKTHSFKSMNILVLFLSFLSVLAFTLTLALRSQIVVYILASIFGVFIGGHLLVGFEVSTELTYPESESTTAGMLLIPPAILGIIFTMMYSWLIENVGDMWGGAALSATLVVATAIAVLIKPDYRRVAGNREPMQDESTNTSHEKQQCNE